MKTNIPALAILAAILPACAAAQERAPELPTLSSVVGELGRPAEARSHALGAPAKSARTTQIACLAWASTVQIGRGVFQNDYTVKMGGQDAATVEAVDGGYVIKDKSGTVQASAAVAESGGKRTATVTGCNGQPLGVIEELIGSDSSAFNIKAPDGTPLMTTGWVDGGDMAASAPKASMKVERNGIFDHFTATIYGAAPEVGVIATVMNNAAGYRRASERRRDRMMDGPHGRADR